MATPLVSGSIALLRQWLSEKKGLSSPQAATLKALVCAGACSLAPGQYGTGSYREIPSTYPNNVEGWGEVNIGNSVGSGSSEPMVYDKQVISESEVHTYKVKVSSGGGKLTIIMAYTDAPSALVSSKNLVNDLDIKVITPSGQELYPNSMNSPDRINNMEGIRISNAESGIYTITVTAYNIVTPMSYSLTGMDNAVLYSLVGCGDYLGGASYGEDEPDDPQPEYHFVAFYPQNGESVIKKEMYTVGASYGEFPEFKYDGYEFVGWFTEPEGGIQIYETDIVTKEFAKLYAQWRVEKKYIAVSFDANGGSVYPSSYQYIIGDLYENLPTPTYIDHIFKGWYTRQFGGTLVTEDSIVSESVSVLYAHWEIVQRDFPNFSFVTPVGWDSSVFVSKSRASDSVSTLYAGEEFFINIAYKNTGTLDAMNIGKVSYSIECNDSGIELISGTHTGSYKLLIGEIEKFNTVPYFLNEPGSYTLTVTLNSDGIIEESDYTDNRQTYSFVVLPSDDNGGGDGDGDGDSGIPNFTFEKPSDWPAAVFLSKERAVGMSKVFRPNENIYINWAYIANGIENPKECDVHIAVIDSKTGEEWYSLDYSASGSVVVSGGACRFSHDFSLYREGEYRLLVFLNPSKTIKETDYTDNEYSIDFSIKEDIVRWNVTFNAAGGSLVGDSIRIVNDGDAVGVLPTPTRDGYTFLGWFTAAEGGTQVTADTVVTGDMTLYAQWGVLETLTVSASSVSAEASGASGTISVTANCGWTVTKDASWIMVSPTSGNGNGTVSYTVSANNSTSKRTGTITVKTSGGVSRTISLTQKGKDIEYTAEITSVTVSPRWPWNGKVDIDYTLTTQPSGTKAKIALFGRDGVLNRTLTATSLSGVGADGSAVEAGTHRITWDVGADYPNFHTKDFMVDVTATEVAEEENPLKDGLYLVIDLSGGVNAASYPISYLDDVPSCGWTDEYKTTKLVLRKIQAGTFMMGSSEDELGRTDSETMHQVTISKPFYIGVYEVTQRQYELVMGTRPSYFNNDSYYQTRPVEQVSWNDIRGDSSTYNWPSSANVDPSTFIGKLRSKTGIALLDLPTAAKWEYACRAGTTTAFNSGKCLTGNEMCPNAAEVGRYWNNGGSGSTSSCDTVNGTAKVGSYLPNAWGLYDMHGNVHEWCLDWKGEYVTGMQMDPVGMTYGSVKESRGGNWISFAWCCRSAHRGTDDPAIGNNGVGFRLSCSAKED